MQATDCPIAIGNALRAKIAGRPDVGPQAQQLAFALDYENEIARRAGVDLREYWATDFLTLQHNIGNETAPVKWSTTYHNRFHKWLQVAKGQARLHLLFLVCAKAPNKQDAGKAAAGVGVPLPPAPETATSVLRQYTRATGGSYDPAGAVLMWHEAMILHGLNRALRRLFPDRPEREDVCAIFLSFM